MSGLETSIVIRAPVDKVYAYWALPEHVFSWPNVVHITDVQRLPNGGASYRWTYSLGGMRLDGTVEDVELVSNERHARKIGGAIDVMLIARFQPEEEGTRVTLEVNYRVPIPVLGKMAEAFILQGMEREINAMLANLKRALEA
jgi:uncharacterized membrane protein